MVHTDGRDESDLVFVEEITFTVKNKKVTILTKDITVTTEHLNTVVDFNFDAIKISDSS